MLSGRGYLLRETTNNYLDQLDPNNLPPPNEIEGDLLQLARAAIDTQNALLSKGGKYQQIQNLTPDQVFTIVSRLYHFRRIYFTEQFTASSDSYLFTIYHDSGPLEGLYTQDDMLIETIIDSYNCELTGQQTDMILRKLESSAKAVKRTLDPDLIPVKNGVFNYKTKQLLPFSPEYTFLTKLQVDYVDNPVNPIIHNSDDGTDWDVESWMQELSDNKEIVNLLWEVIGASVRPFVLWNKTAWLYSRVGNNGKGTLCQLMRNLLGPAATSISIAQFSKEFYLESLIQSTTIVTDENNVGEYIDRVGNLKSVVTGDVIQINRKFKAPISFRFCGFMVQCLNEMPRIRDKSDSFYRRQLFVPFDKSFTGIERKYIKADYLGRQDVLEYVLHRVLNMDYYSLSNPAACQEVLQDYKSYNDPVREFVQEMLPQCQWQLLPYTFLYALFKAWFAKNCPSSQLLSRNDFKDELCGVLISDGSIWQPVPGQVRSKNYMVGPEPLIDEYGLTDWMNKTYRGPDVNKVCLPKLSVSYRGIFRYDNNCDSDDEE